MKAIRLTRAGILFALISLALLAGCEPGMHPPSAQAGVRGGPDPITTGKRLLAWNQPEMALKAFNRGIATGGGPTAMTGSAIALLKMGRVGEARTLLNRALSIAPNLPTGRNALGVALYKSRMYQAALYEFRRANELTGGHDRAIAFNIGMTETALLRLAAENPPEPEYKFDVVRYGNGVYRLKPRVKTGKKRT